MTTHPGLKVFLALAILVVAAAVGYGIYLVGSPAGQRSLKFDERRVSDLENISYAVDAYWDRTKGLPDTLEGLKGPRYFVQSIEDPETGAPYEYRVIDGANYELCAVFNAASAQEEKGFPRLYSARMAEHAAGRVCFQLEAEAHGDGKPREAPGDIRPVEPARP